MIALLSPLNVLMRDALEVSPPPSNGMQHKYVHKHHNRGNTWGNKIVNLEHGLLERKGLKRLVDSLEAYSNGKELWGSTVFYDIDVTYRTHNEFVHETDGKGESQKYFIGKNALKLLGKDFIIYGAGVANNPIFENYMASEMNSSVFAFDCTNQKNPEWNQIIFYSWCIGTKRDFGNSIYARNSENMDFQFYTLGEIKKKLNHTHIDMLKMDIEGSEWDVLKSLLGSDDEDLPSQLLFELHTEGANSRYVPPDNVKGKGRRQVTQLIYDLYQRHYRVTNIELNSKDLHCAEISLIRIIA